MPGPSDERAREPRPNSRVVWGILNPYGDVWTTDTFDTPEAAREHLARFWSSATIPGAAKGFKIVQCLVTVSALPTANPGEPPHAGTD